MSDRRSVQEDPSSPRVARGTLLAGGLALIGGALAFLGVFARARC